MKMASKRLAGLMVAVALVASSPTQAGGLKPAGVPIAVARSGLWVTPDQSWNKGERPGRLSEGWTMDGLTINELTFYGGIADNKTLFREVDKTNRPLPRFSKTMLLPDIAQLLETSYRVALGTPLMKIEAMEPAPFAGSQGFHFAYSFTTEDDVKRKGEARGAIINGALYMITYEAPRIHYFARDLGSFNKIADSAVIKAGKK
jgi:hypothetical protein